MLTTRTETRLAQALYRSLHAFRSLAGLGDAVQVRRRGVRWALELNEGIDLSIYLLGAFEPRTVTAYERLLSPGDTVLDIGANIGAHTLHMARCVAPGGRVFAFEPTDYAFAKLRGNVLLNPELARIITIEKMLLGDDSNRPPPTRVYSSWPLTAGEAVHAKHRGRLMDAAAATRCTLDEYLRSKNVCSVRFVKMDVDGHECAVLRGAAKTLGVMHPTMLVEFMPYGLEETGDSFEELIDILANANYRLSDATTGNALPGDAASLRRMIPDGAGINALATAA